MKNTSWFGYTSNNPADCAAFDLCILEEIEREEKEWKLRKDYPRKEDIDDGDRD